MFANRRVDGGTSRCTAVDFAEQWLVDEAYPEAKVIRLVLDNLNTHKLGSLYELFAPPEARRIAKRLELHHTPNHGSWLNPSSSAGSVYRRVSDEALLMRLRRSNASATRPPPS